MGLPPRLPSLLALFALAACQAPGEAGRTEAPVGWIDSAQMVCPGGPTLEGVDVSHWQGTIDWAKVKAAGIDFALFKATEHTMFFDDQFAANWKNTKANGIIRGAYHFFRPSFDPLQQAEWFVYRAGIPEDGDLPPVLDLEETDSLAPADVAAGALKFLGRVELLTGRVPMIYTSNRVFNTVLGGPPGFGRYPLWVANWGVQCPNIPDPTWKDWTLWQYTASGTVNGITGQGRIDRDVFNGSLADLRRFVSVPGRPGDMAVRADLGSGADLASAPGDLSTTPAGDLATGDQAQPADPIPSGCDVTAGAPSPSQGSWFGWLMLAGLIGRHYRRSRP